MIESAKHRIVNGTPWVILATTLSLGCPQRYREDLNYSYAVEQEINLNEVNTGRFIQFESVPWDADNHHHIRHLISADQIAAGRRVFDSDSGTGVIAVLCAINGAKKVVATDRNPAAIANTDYNAALHAVDDKVDARLIDPNDNHVFSGIGSTEEFDLILLRGTNRRSVAQTTAEIESCLDNVAQHLTVGGRCLLYGYQTSQLESWRDLCDQRGLRCDPVTDKQRPDLANSGTDALIFPAMIVEIRVGKGEQAKSN